MTHPARTLVTAHLANGLRRLAAYGVPLAAGAAIALGAGAAHAQSDYPAKPLTLVVTYAPGGAVDIVKRLNSEVDKVLASQEMKERLSTLSAQPLGGTSQTFAQRYAAEAKSWAETVRAAGLKAE